MRGHRDIHNVDYQPGARYSQILCGFADPPTLSVQCIRGHVPRVTPRVSFRRLGALYSQQKSLRSHHFAILQLWMVFRMPIVDVRRSDGNYSASIGGP